MGDLFGISAYAVKISVSADASADSGFVGDDRMLVASETEKKIRHASAIESSVDVFVEGSVVGCFRRCRRFTRR